MRAVSRLFLPTRSRATAPDADAARPLTRALRVTVPQNPREDWAGSLAEAAADAGYNAIVLDAFTHGLPMFPCLTAQDCGLPLIAPGLRGTDPLGELCHAALRRGLVVHAAMRFLAVGSGRSHPRSALAGRWRLLARRSDGRPVEAPVDGEPSRFLCPANREVRNMLSGIGAELAAAYPVTALLVEGFALPESGDPAGLPGCHCPFCAPAAETAAAAPKNESAEDAPESVRQLATEPEDDLLYDFKARVRRLRAGVMIGGFVDRLDAARVRAAEGLLDLVVVSGAEPAKAELAFPVPALWQHATPEPLVPRLPPPFAGTVHRLGGEAAAEVNLVAFPDVDDPVESVSTEADPLRSAEWHLRAATAALPSGARQPALAETLQSLSNTENLDFDVLYECCRKLAGLAESDAGGEALADTRESAARAASCLRLALTR